MTTATAQACANIAFIKYWGNRDNALRIPLPKPARILHSQCSQPQYSIELTARLVLTANLSLADIFTNANNTAHMIDSAHLKLER
jgi:mevalonate pyrophosphate decarboxylase